MDCKRKLSKLSTALSNVPAQIVILPSHILLRGPALSKVNYVLHFEHCSVFLKQTLQLCIFYLGDSFLFQQFIVATFFVCYVRLRFHSFICKFCKMHS